MQVKSIAIVNRNSPYRGFNGQESLDFSLVAASFGQNVALFFSDDGVFQLLKQQSPESLGRKNFSKTFGALEFYDVERVYVCKESLAQRHLTLDNLLINVKAIDNNQWQQLLNEFDHVVSF